jgi:hypothetical protein
VSFFYTLNFNKVGWRNILTSIRVEHNWPMYGEAMRPAPANKYDHMTFTELTRPDLAAEAWRVHAEGYQAMGFVNQDAVDEHGYMAADIDKARGPHVDYYRASNPSNAQDQATMRKINIPYGGSYQDLPAFRLCQDSLNPLGRRLLGSLQNPDQRLKEIGALARTAEAQPLAVHELFRTTIQEALGKDEIWFFSIVTSTHESLAKSFGERNFNVIGDDVPIGEDSRVGDHIALRPTLLRPDEFIDNILLSLDEAQTIPAQVRYQRSLLFFTDGLPINLMSERVALARQAILMDQAAPAPRKG